MLTSCCSSMGNADCIGVLQNSGESGKGFIRVALPVQVWHLALVAPALVQQCGMATKGIGRM